MAYVKRGCKELRKDWPHEKGLTAGTETQEGRSMNLIPSKGSNVLKEERTGFS